MTKIIHDITVDGYRIKPDSISVGTAGSYGVEQIRFSFSSEWDNLAIDVIFTDAQKENNIIMQAVDRTALITIPWEATQYKGTAKMTVRGMSDGVNILSLQCDMDIENTLAMDETTNPTATDTAYQQIRVLMQETKESADNALSSANQLITEAEELITVSTENKDTAIEKATEAGNYASQTEDKYNQVNEMYQDVLNKAMQVTADKNTVVSAKEEVTADKSYIDTKASEVTETATNGITQMNAILSEAQTTVGNIPDEISDIKAYIEYNEQNVKNNFANAIKGSKNGAIVGIDDISPIEHTMKTKVRSKNLWQHTNGDTYTSQNRASYDSETKIYTVSSSGVKWYTHTLANPIPKNTAVSITVEVTSGVGSVSIGGCHKEDNNISWQGSIDLPNNIDLSGKTYTASFTTTDTVTDFLIFVDVGTPITTPVVFRVQYEIGTTSTAYAPYISDLTAVKLSRYGKNLLNFNAKYESSNIKNFITTENSFSFKNVNTKKSSYVSFNIYLQAGTYYINGTVSQDDVLKGGWTLVDDTNTILINDASRGVISKKFTITTTGVYKFCFYCNYNSPAETTVTYSNVQLEIGTTATEYEPYVTSVDYTPNADGTVDGVTSLYPNTTLITNMDGVIIDCEYNKDTNNVIEKLTQAIIALGGNV